MLTNAVYFLGSWDSPFDETETHDANFFRSKDDAVTVKMMHQFENFAYGESDQFAVLHMPYKSDRCEVQLDDGESNQPRRVVIPGRFAMVVILPNRDMNTTQVSRKLSDEGIEGLPLSEQREVRVYVPKFRTESSFFLGDGLRALGVSDALSIEKANFSGMSDDPEGLFISEVLHKAFVDVNETGTEAAAATAMVLLAGGVSTPPPPVEFRADRPFVFLIQDRLTGLVHFIGQYVGPEDK